MKWRKRNRKRLPRSLAEIMTILKREGNTFLTEEGRIMDLMQIKCKDIESISDDELMSDEASFENLYRTMRSDIKIIGINFPTDTSVQTGYFMKKLAETENPVYREQIRRRLDEFEYLRRLVTAREYYLMFFSSDPDQYRENLRIIRRSLNGGGIDLIKEIPVEKKLQILRFMHNVNEMNE